MKAKNLLTILMFASAMFLLSCKHDNLETIGPSICGVSDDFTILSNLAVSSDPVDLSLGSMTFTASFSETAPWKIYIKGTMSGAVKVLSGNDKEVNVTWDGSSDTVFFFRNELVTTSLKIPCRDEFAGPDFTISTTKVHDGILVSDFEGNGLVATWSTSSQGTLQSNGIGNTITPPQGNSYYYMQGIDDNNDYGVGLLMHNSVTFGLPTDPNTVYLNVFVKGIPNSRLDLRVLEADGDQWTNVQYITWTGWKLVSVKYTDFDLTTGTGINGRNPEICSRVRFLLKSSPPGSAVEVNLDYVVFTVGAPFTP